MKNIEKESITIRQTTLSERELEIEYLTLELKNIQQKRDWKFEVRIEQGTVWGTEATRNNSSDAIKGNIKLWEVS